MGIGLNLKSMADMMMGRIDELKWDKRTNGRGAMTQSAK
jgi:hypothetical protein